MKDPLDELVAEGRSKRHEAEDADVDRETKSRLWASASSFALWQWWAWAIVATIPTGIVLHEINGFR